MLKHTKCRENSFKIIMFVCNVCHCCLTFLAHKSEMAEDDEYLMDCIYVIYSA